MSQEQPGERRQSHRFELARLDSYDTPSLIAELQRVASLVTSAVLTQAEFDRHSKASASVIRRRFDGWARALEAAGLTDRYSGTPEPRRTLVHGARTFSDEELLSGLRVVADKLGRRTVTVEQFNQHGTMNPETIRRRFGSWRRAVEAAGLVISNRGRRYSESNYFENLLLVWTHYGRQPTYGEMESAPSRIGAGAYEAKWGTWRGALRAFVERVNADVADAAVADRALVQPPPVNNQVVVSRPEPRSRRRVGISLGLRYDVLRRDRFRCVLCGSNPASKVGCELHLDHITPVALGGMTVVENLRTLCDDCNLGKGAKVEQ